MLEKLLKPVGTFLKPVPQEYLSEQEKLFNTFLDKSEAVKVLKFLQRYIHGGPIRQQYRPSYIMLSVPFGDALDSTAPVFFTHTQDADTIGVLVQKYPIADTCHMSVDLSKATENDSPITVYFGMTTFLPIDRPHNRKVNTQLYNERGNLSLDYGITVHRFTPLPLQQFYSPQSDYWSQSFSLMGNSEILPALHPDRIKPEIEKLTYLYDNKVRT